MKIQTLKTTPLETNTYIVTDSGRGFVVDPGGEAERIEQIFKTENAVIEAVLLTHGHADHIAAAAALQRLGARVIIHEKDAELIGTIKSLSFAIGVSVEKFTPDLTVTGGETLNVAGIPVKVIYTPGHTAGGVCYIMADCIFAGDTLFYTSYGRTDFPTGDFKQLKNSILNKLFNLSGDYTVYPGHGDATSLDFERQNNMIRI